MADTERPSETRRDESMTRRDTAPGHGSPMDATRRDAEPPGPPLVRLPAELAGRFSVLGELPAQGAESDLLHVRDGDGTELVVKIFRRGFTADRSVWRKLPTLDSPHVVRILETGHAEGRDYEVIEYIPAGNLRAVGDRPPPALVSEVAAQLSAGLARLHEAGIVHRDLKPENVLVRGTDPLRLAITDFGLSRVIEQSVVFASSSRTLAYAAPESLSGQVSPARDWWSLGIILRELLTGRRPFAGMSETAVVDHLATRTLDCGDIDDPRMRLLCRGLLTRDPRRRWTGREVEEWLRGESPAVAEPSPAASPLLSGQAREVLAFGGRSFTDRTELARALVADWASAERYFFGTMFTPVGPSEAWQALRGWLNSFDDDAEGRIRLIDESLTGEHQPDVKLLHLVRWLDPTIAPHYLGLRLLPEDLPGLAAAVDDPASPDHATAARAVRGLWQHRLLPELVGFAGGEELAEVHHRWQGLTASWHQLAGWLRSQLPRAAGRFPDAGAPGFDEPPAILAMLLALAGLPEESGRALRAAADRSRGSVKEHVPWFAWLSDQAGEDPLRLLALVRATPDAVLEVEASARRRDEAGRRTAEGLRRWEQRENGRLAGRRPAVIRAVLWTLPLAALWLGGSWLAPHLLDSASVRSTTGSTGTAGDPTSFLLFVAVLAWLVEAGCEAVVATRQGTEYLPLGPWAWLAKVLRGAGRGLSGASRQVSGAARSSGPRGCGVLLLIGIVPLFLIVILFATVLSIAWLLWLAVLVVVPIGHVIATGIRLQRWRQEHQRAREQVVGGRQ